MENFAELMHRLLEIQSGERQRSLELIAEDERLMDALQKKNLTGNATQTERLAKMVQSGCDSRLDFFRRRLWLGENATVQTVKSVIGPEVPAVNTCASGLKNCGKRQ